MSADSSSSASSFEARILLHGVGSYVPHVNGDKLLVLFPDQNHAIERGIRAPEGGEICRHHMVLQMDARALRPDLPPGIWLTLNVAKHWIGFESDREKGTDLTRLQAGGLAPIRELLEGAGLDAASGLDPAALPGPDFDSRLLAAGFFADAGVASPSGSYEGPFELGFDPEGEWGEPVMLSSVIQVELGKVGRFAVTLLPFGAAPETAATIELHSPEDQLDIWIRHFCDLEKPDPDRHVSEPGELDADFVLNYALRENLPELLEKSAGRLQVPRVDKNWSEGGSVAGKPRQCMGYLETSMLFGNPRGT